MQMFKLPAVAVARVWVRWVRMQLQETVAVVALDSLTLTLERQLFMVAEVVVENEPTLELQDLEGQEVAVLVEKQQTVLPDQQTLAVVEVEAAERLMP